MALSDPQVYTVNAVNQSLNKIQAATLNSPSVFQTADGFYKMTVSHAYGKRLRHIVRVDHKKVAPDPIQPVTNSPYSLSAYLVVDVPLVGYSLSDQQLIVAGLPTWLTVTSGANLTKLLQSET